MSNKINFAGADTLLTNEEKAVLQRGIFIGENAPQKIKEFCNGLWAEDYIYSALSGRGYTYNDIARAACILSLIAAKTQPCYGINIYGFNIKTYESGTVKTNCYIQVDGAPLIHICENFDEGGWTILHLDPGTVRDKELLEALFIASVELSQ